MSKTLLKVGASLLAIGLIVVAVCALLGGTALLRDTFTGRGFRGLFRFHVGSAGFIDDDYEIYRSDIEKTFSADTVHGFSLKAEAIDVEIIETDRTDILVKTDDVDRAQAYMEDGMLCIAGEGPDWGFDSAGEFYIEIPRGFSVRDMEIEIGAGSFDADNLSSKNLELEVGAGELLVDILKAETVSLEVGAGKCDIKNGDIEDIEVNVGMGSFTYSGRISDDMEAECGMGNMDMKLLGKETEHNYDLECAMGNMKVGNYGGAGIVVEKQINNGVSSDYRMECGMGNVMVSFAE